MSSNEGIAAFLAARLDEDEAAAKLAAREGGTWTQDDPVRYPGSISSLGGPVVYDEGAPDEYQGTHIARHDPARVLREVAAKRAILSEHAHVAASTPSFRKGPEPFGCFTCDYVPGEGTYGGGWCTTVRILAAIWSDHPDYEQEWQPG